MGGKNTSVCYSVDSKLLWIKVNTFLKRRKKEGNATLQLTLLQGEPAISYLLIFTHSKMEDLYSINSIYPVFFLHFYLTQNMTF